MHFGLMQGIVFGMVYIGIYGLIQFPREERKGNKAGNIMTGHIVYREAKMTFSRKAFLRIFDNKEFSQLVYW